MNLHQPYDRAILIELLETVANDANVEISVFEYSENMTTSTAMSTGSNSKPVSQPNSRPASAKLGGNGGNLSAGSRPTSANPSGGSATTISQLPGGQLYKVVKFEEPQPELSKEELKELDDLQSFAHVQDLTLQELVVLAKVERS